MSIIPETGMIVVLAPDVAAKAVELHPHLADRIFNAKGVQPKQAFIIDLGVLNRELEDALNPWVRHVG